MGRCFEGIWADRWQFKLMNLQLSERACGHEPHSPPLPGTIYIMFPLVGTSLVFHLSPV
eukprot:c23024_g1_i1 orf=289-465(+)